MTLLIQSSMRTHSISATHLTSPSDGHQEALTAQGAQAGPEAQTILTEDHTNQQLFLPTTSSPSSPPETLSRLEYPPYSSMETELGPTLSSESSEST